MLNKSSKNFTEKIIQRWNCEILSNMISYSKQCKQNKDICNSLEMTRIFTILQTSYCWTAIRASIDQGGWGIFLGKSGQITSKSTIRPTRIDPSSELGVFFFLQNGYLNKFYFQTSSKSDFRSSLNCSIFHV